MASKLFDWDVGNIIVLQKLPKNGPKTAILDFSLFSLNFLQSFFTILVSYMCTGIEILWQRHLRNWAKTSAKRPKNGYFRTLKLRKNVHTTQTKFSTVFLHNILYVQWHQQCMTEVWETAIFDFFHILKNSSYDSNEIVCSHCHHTRVLNVKWLFNRMDGMWARWSKLGQNAKKRPFFGFFWFSQKLFIRFERKFLPFSYTLLEPLLCNDIEIKWLECEKDNQN